MKMKRRLNFTPEKPLPKELIERIVRERMKESGFT